MKRKVQVVIIDKNEETPRLLQFKTNALRGGFWQNITGSVEEGETWEEAAVRELFEESGLKLGPLTDLNFHFKFLIKKEKTVEEHCFLALLTSAHVVQLSHEHDEFRYIPLEDVRPEHFGFASSYDAFLKAKLKAQ